MTNLQKNEAFCHTPAATTGPGSTSEATFLREVEGGRTGSTKLPSAGFGSSRVRLRGSSEGSQAERRVTEYLRALGLCDEMLVAKTAAECAAATAVGEMPSHAERAVRFAQSRVENWKREVFDDLGGEPNALWLRALLTERPEIFASDVESAREVARAFGNAELGLRTPTLRFKEQSIERLRLPAWTRGVLLSLTAALTATLLLARATEPSRASLEATATLTMLRWLWLGLFSVLFGQACWGFFTALAGLFARVHRASPLLARSERDLRLENGAPRTESGARPVESGAQAVEKLPRSAIAIPIYHEDAARVFANVAAMRESLLGLPEAEALEFFVLSDSQDPWRAADEERALRRVTATTGEGLPIYYRRRSNNERQKVGNIGEFFERFGHRYAHVLVLDADSMMHGSTIVELLRRIEAAPEVGLLQAPIVQVGGSTLLSRCLQWSTSTAGPLFTRGLALWSGPHGNYYGHNAVIRTRAFLESCSLPPLLGRPPLGGPILSHDFVEAALLCREGWEVRTATDLGGSFEGQPETLRDYVLRDKRWCQGNLQHLRVLLAPGLKPMSRIHLLVGALSYLAGPIWLAYLLLGLSLTSAGVLHLPSVAGFLAATATLLFVPRLLGVLRTLAHPENRRGHGGLLSLVGSLTLETLLSASLAPLLLFHHTRIVVAALLGQSARWTSQRRGAGSALLTSARAELGPTLFGLALMAGISVAAPGLLLWLSPVWGPLCLAIPISLLLSSSTLGGLARRGRLLLVPTEVTPDPLLTASDELLTLTEGDTAGRFRDLVLDPVLLDAHIRRLPPSDKAPVRASRAATPRPPALAETRERALRLGPAGLTDDERQRLLEDAESLRWLHQQAWCHWPVEAWWIGRDRPQLPV